LGNEDLEGRTQEEVWRSLSQRNPGLRAFIEYQLFVGQEEVGWRDLPRIDVTMVPKVIQVSDRGPEFKLIDRHNVPLPRTVGQLTRVGCQLFTAERTLVGEEMSFVVPN
jgi:hypothetical protein